MTVGSSLVRLKAAADSQARIISRIDELEHILSDTKNSNIVQRSKAQVELAQLEKQVQTDCRRSSVRNLSGAGVVTKNRTQFNAESDERLRREEELRRLMEELKNAGKGLSAARRQQLEDELKAAQDALDDMACESASNSPNDSYSAQYANIGYDDTTEEGDIGNTATSTRSILMDEILQMESALIEEEDEDLVSPTTPNTITPRPSEKETEEDGHGEKIKTLVVPTLKGEEEHDEKMRELEGQAAKLNNVMLEEDDEERELTKALGDALEGIGIDELAADNEHGGKDDDVVNECCLYWKTRTNELELALQESMKRIKDLEDVAHAEAMARKMGLGLESPRPSRPSLSSSGRPSLTSSGRSSRRFSRMSLSSQNPRMSASLQRASQMGLGLDEQMKEEAKLEMLALEDRLKDIGGEKADLLAEIATMKALIAAAEGKPAGKKTERLVYQLSCKKCNKLSSCVGTTHDDIKTTMKRHFDQVYEATKGKKGDLPKPSDNDKLNWSIDFTTHFAKHCKPAIKFKSVSKKDVVTFCRQNVKVEVLKRSDGAELYWEDEE